VATPRTEQRVLWAFWLACGLSAVAGVVPMVLGGGSNRIGGVVIPFAVAAILLGACALLYAQGRPIATLLYFLASLAIVYGLLAMLTLPLRLAVIGTCPPAPAVCGSGLERPMTSGESNALGLAVGLGIVAILTGFFGLVTLYRRDTGARLQSLPPPDRRIAPVGAKTQSPTEAPTPEPAAPPTPVKTEAEAEPAPEAVLELAAPVEPLELPEVGTEDLVEVAPPAPQRKPRRKRVPKATLDTPTTPDTDESA
jgi:hypothetical protein